MDDDVAALAAVLDSVQDSLRDSIGGGLGALPGRPESWGFVGTPIADALALLRVARRATPAKSPRLLECGSGFGFIAALAREIGFTATGIEIEPAYVECSRRLFPSVRILETDLLTFDGFGDFDVVYYYCPFSDDDVQARFERRVEEALRPGGIVAATRKISDDWRAAGAFETLSTNGSHAWVIQKKAAPPGAR